jgi:hypothetical protein
LYRDRRQLRRIHHTGQRSGRWLPRRRRSGCQRGLHMAELAIEDVPTPNGLIRRCARTTDRPLFAVCARLTICPGSPARWPCALTFWSTFGALLVPTDEYITPKKSRHRNANACALVGRRAHHCNVSRLSSVSTTSVRCAIADPHRCR